jgi:DNA-3-methyladenine glycosylase
VYVSYGIHHCVNVVTGRDDWANGVLLRAACLPGVAAGPALLARRFGIDRSVDALPLDPANGLWLAPRDAELQRLLAAPGCRADGAAVAGPGAEASADASQPALSPALLPSPSLVQTSRIGISQGQHLPWRWYLRASRCVSRRASGDRPPSRLEAWTPAAEDLPLSGVGPGPAV